MKSLPTYTATIYCGLRLGYTGPITPAEVLRQECRRFVDEIGLAVSFTATEFIYTNGWEPGIIVGLIAYPRFPQPTSKIKAQAITLARLLMARANQERVTVVCSDETIMLEKEAA